MNNREEFGQLNKLDAKKKIARHGKFRIAITVLLAIILLLLLWGAIYTTADVNSYRIVVDGKRGGSLSLSFEPEFSGEGFSVLKGLGVRNSKNAQGTGYTEGISDYVEKVASGEIPMELELGGQAGKAASDGTDQFIASKFYLKNVSDLGSDPLKYKLRINVLENTKNALSAARFYVISDTENERKKAMFAQPASDGSNEKVATKYVGSDSYVSDPDNPDLDWECISLSVTDSGKWYYDSYELENTSFELKAQEAVGYCICVYYEGSDPDHNNDILGGYITFNISFSVVE